MVLHISGPSEGLAAHNGAVLASVPPMRSRCVEAIPALLTMMLHDLGKLPDIPNKPVPGALGFRLPTFADMEAVTWLALWEGSRTDEHGFRKVAGLASFKDYYSHHDSADVREIVSLRGSPRSLLELMYYMRDDAEVNHRRLVGVFDRWDLGVTNLADRVGGYPTERRLWSYQPCRG
jgi:hypothetical protein